MKTHHLSLTLTILLIFTSVSARAHDLPKMASVDMAELFKQYHRTAAAQKLINVERARIQMENNERLARINEREGQMKNLRAMIEDPGTVDEKKRECAESLKMMTQEANALEKERSEYLQRRNGALNEKMTKQMLDIIQEIQTGVEKLAKAGGYKVVVDKSGLSKSQTPFLIYSELEDLTAQILLELNKESPAGE